MKIRIQALKPRNPLVGAALQRRAGSHRPQGGAIRQRAKSELQREMKRAFDPPAPLSP